MNQSIVINQFKNLPDNIQREVSDYINFLSSKYNITFEKGTKQSRNGFGILKGKIIMSDDFNEPLSEFEEYI